MPQHELYAFGSNGSGQLGLGSIEDASTPTKCLTVEADFNGRPCKIAAGGNHTLILCDDGSVYAAGLSVDGRCGFEASDEKCTRFRRVSFLDIGQRVIDKFSVCSATWEASTFITSDNEVYTTGTGRKGELGQGPNIVDSVKPRLVADFPPLNTKIVDLAASISHTVAVLSNGDVYGWGSNRKGQLGTTLTDTTIPRRFDSFSFPALRAVCGREFTYVLGSADDGAHAILGSDKWKVRSSAPAAMVGWQAIGASWGGIYVLLRTGKLLGWGRNEHGQLPRSDLPEVKLFCVGSEHLIAKSAVGKIFAWGWGEHGNCGRSTLVEEENAEGWNEITLTRPSSPIGAGCATSWLLINTSVGTESLPNCG